MLGCHCTARTNCFEVLGAPQRVIHTLEHCYPDMALWMVISLTNLLAAQCAQLQLQQRDQFDTHSMTL
jgi:hypothetical protein